MSFADLLSKENFVYLIEEVNVASNLIGSNLFLLIKNILSLASFYTLAISFLSSGLEVTSYAHALRTVIFFSFQQQILALGR